MTRAAILLVLCVAVHHAFAQQAKSFVLEGAGARRTHVCAPGQNVEVKGSGHVVTLLGECGAVTVTGTSSQVELDSAASIAVNGVGNKVTWRRGTPRVAQAGLMNQVSPRP
jgi:hypothetical protein